MAEKQYKVLKKFVFEDVPLKIKVGEVEPAYYHEHKSKPPKRMLKELDIVYDYDDDGFLIYIANNERVIKNREAVEQGKWLHINGNLLWELPVTAEAARVKVGEISKIKNHLTDYYRKRIQRFPIDVNDFPLGFTFHFRLKPEDCNQDIDNLCLFHKKSFFDAIQTTYYKGKGKAQKLMTNPNGFMPDDSLTYINRDTEMIDVDEKVKRNTLVVIIYSKK